MSTREVDVAVVGAGPAGIVAAVEAARAGLAVALVEAAGVGGRAAWATQIPWRCLERAADAGGTFRGAMDEARRRAERWEERLSLRLEDAGVERFTGRARFLDPRTLEVGERRVAFDRAIVACGARPITLDGDAPDGRRLLRPDDLVALDALPSSLLVVGGGAAGAELCDALSRLGGVELTWVMDELGLLPRFDRELAEAFGDVLMERGVKLVHGKAARSAAIDDGGVTVTLDGGRTYAAPVAVVALGSRPAFDGLDLEAAGIEAGATVDETCRLSDTLFAAGACVGAPSAAAAESMGRVAGRQAAAALGVGASSARCRLDRVPLVARTRPLLAQVGATPERVTGRDVIYHSLRFEETLAGLLDEIGETDHAKGHVRVVCDSDTGEILGATALGPGAPEIASAVSLAMTVGAKDEDLADVFAALPSALDAAVRATR